MSYLNKKLVLFTSLFSMAVLLTAGCQKDEVTVNKKINASTINQAVASVNLNKENCKPFRAWGNCRAKFYSDGNRYDEKFKVKFWISPPSRLRFHGDVFFDPRGIDLGANEDYFWLVTKPKEIRSYQWGKWSDKVRFDDMMINPGQLLGAFGFIEDISEENVTLVNMHKYDLILRKDFMGQYQERIYIDNRSRMVAKIEYFNKNNEISLLTELKNYQLIDDTFKVPMSIHIVANPNAAKHEIIDIKIDLRSVKQQQINEKIFLTRPKTDGFDRITEYTADGLVLEKVK